jgi:hypothetical protein
MKTLLQITSVICACLAFGSVQAEHLRSWNEGSSKSAIYSFVKKTTTAGSPEFIEPEDRIAVFDNDGTLWAEQPFYFQLAFAIDRIKALAPLNPEWKDKEPFRSILSGDIKAVLAGGEKSILELVMATHAGMSTDEFEIIVKDWITSAKHPETDKLYKQMVYKPMLELLEYLHLNGFKTYIVSGGGVEFMRPWVNTVYGIPPEQVLGSRVKLNLEIRDNKPLLVKLPEIDFIDDGPGKPIGIQQLIGRRPVMAFGNSDGDLQMLDWTCSAVGPRFCLYLHHTDAEREWAYDRESHIGKLDKGLDAANTKGWTVVDKKKDWNRVFP